jgi:c-di-GMP-binding flagellar brake protein YcgR
MTAAQGTNERFLVRSPVEVAFILKAVMQAGQMVTAQCGEGRILLVTKILAVNRQANEVMLGAGKEDKTNAHLVDGRLVVFTTSQDRVKIQFQSTRASLVEFEGLPALRIAMPGTLLKFQRREYYRADSSSLTRPVRCRLRLPAGYVDAVVVDVSLGGVLLAGYPETVPMKPGAQFDDVRIDLGKAGAFSTSLVVRNVSEVSLRNGTLSRRAGCMFIHLPPRAEALLQRYIMSLDRERLTRGVGD